MLETAAEGFPWIQRFRVEITTGSNMATEGMETATGGSKVVGTETGEATAMVGTTIGGIIVAIVVFAAPGITAETTTVPSLDQRSGRRGQTKVRRSRQTPRSQQQKAIALQ